MNIINHDPTFEALLSYLKQTRGFDFTGYKRAGLMRRFQKQLQIVGVESFSDYVDYLEVHPDEFAALFNAILINVTAFFRDLEAWNFLREEIIPSLLAAKNTLDPIRVWSAGCASGEEAYSLAMLLAEAMEMDQFRQRVKIYATDVDEDALTYARHASYGAREVAGIPETLLAKYFERAESRFLFTRDLRRNVIFGRNDLVQDAPISRVDLLLCRNTLMYLNAEAQARILSRFHFALNNDGFLFLGKAEMLFSHANLFQPHSMKWRIFSQSPRRTVRERLSQPALPLPADRVPGDREALTHRHVRIQEMIFEGGLVAQVVVDSGGQVAFVNEAARTLFRLKTTDVGRPFQDLELSYQPTDLRTMIEQAQASLRPALTREVRWIIGGEPHFLEVQVAPLLDRGEALLGTAITFADVTRSRQLQIELEETNRELETAYEELQSANEELETTNEELQSINEELETTNEELQASNEELETTNEELQSTNEELNTINDEMRQRSSEMDRLNVFMESILTALPGGVIVINSDMVVRIWSQKAEELWGLRAEEAMGRNFLNLDIGLPVQRLRPSIREALSSEDTGRQEDVDAVNRRGRSIRCRVTCSPLRGGDGAAHDILLMTEEVGERLPAAAEEEWEPDGGK